MRTILTNPLYKGQPRAFARRSLTDKRRKEKGLNPGYRVRTAEENQVLLTAPALVSETLWNTCQEQLQINRSLSGSTANKRLLGGLLVCAHCGKKMISRSLTLPPKRGKPNSRSYSYRYYQCRDAATRNNIEEARCDSTLYHAAPVEEAVMNELRAWMSDRASLQKACEAVERDRRKEHKGGDLDTRYQAALREVASAQKNLDAVIDAQIQGSNAGLSISLYEPRLKAAAQRLESAKAAQKEIEKERATLGIKAGMSAKKQAAEQAAAVRFMLHTFETDLFGREMSDGEKNLILRRFIEQVVPQKDYTIQIYLKIFPNPS